MASSLSDCPYDTNSDSYNEFERGYVQANKRRKNGFKDISFGEDSWGASELKGSKVVKESKNSFNSYKYQKGK